jgi:hypothetical protein
MLKLIGLVMLLTAAFGIGYYVGQRPFGNLRTAVTHLSRTVLDTTLGVEKDLRMRQGLVDAKSRLLQAKSDILDRNYGNAAKALSQTAEDLDHAAMIGPESKKDTVKELSRQVQAVQSDLSSGKGKSRGRLDEIQKELDALLATS